MRSTCPRKSYRRPHKIAGRQSESTFPERARIRQLSQKDTGISDRGDILCHSTLAETHVKATPRTRERAPVGRQRRGYTAAAPFGGGGPSGSASVCLPAPPAATLLRNTAAPLAEVLCGDRHLSSVAVSVRPHAFPTIGFGKTGRRLRQVHLTTHAV